MQLETYTDADLWLTEACETDPEVMSHLGGPVDPAEVPITHRRRLNALSVEGAEGDWWLKVIPEPGGPPAGTIGVWDSEWEGQPIHEVGWMLLPGFQGRGVATEALAMLIERIRAEPRFEQIHAFPEASNAASNALCKGAGFVLTETVDANFRDHPMRCNHWILALREESHGLHRPDATAR